MWTTVLPASEFPSGFDYETLLQLLYHTLTTYPYGQEEAP